MLDDEEEIMELNNTITCLKIDLENLNNKYIREKVAKEEVEELLENSVPKEVIREKIEDIEDYFDRLNVPDEDIKFIIEKRKEILGE